MLRVVLTGEYGKVFLDPVKHAVGQESVVDLWLPSEGAERMVEIAREAEVIVASAEWVLHEKRTLVKRTLQNAEKLKLILVPFSGMDWLDRAWLPAGSVVCNTKNWSSPVTSSRGVRTPKTASIRKMACAFQRCMIALTTKV